MSLPTITVPEYEVTLFGQAKPVVFRPYLVKEEKLLMMAQQGEDKKEIEGAIKQLVRNCTFDKVDPGKLATFNFEWLFLLLRAKSVNNVIDVKFRCTQDREIDGKNVTCDTIVPISIDINDIKLTIPEGHTNKIMLSDKLGVIMKYPTVDDAVELENPDLTAVLPKCLKSVFTDDGTVHEVSDQSPEDVQRFVESLSLTHVEKMREQFFETLPRLEHAFTFKCSKCGYTEAIVLRGIQDFFD